MPIENKIYYDSENFVLQMYEDGQYKAIGAINPGASGVEAVDGIFQAVYDSTFDLEQSPFTPMINFLTSDSDGNTITWNPVAPKVKTHGSLGMPIVSRVSGSTPSFTVVPSGLNFSTDLQKIKMETAENYITFRGTVNVPDGRGYTLPRFSNFIGVEGDSFNGGFDSFSDVSSFDLTIRYDLRGLMVDEVNPPKALELLSLGLPKVNKIFSTSATSPFDTNPDGHTLNADGSKLFVAGNTNNSIRRYSLTKPFDFSTIGTTHDQEYVIDVQLGVSAGHTVSSRNLSGIDINDSDNTIYVSNANRSTIYQYELSTPNDLTTLEYKSPYFEHDQIVTSVQNAMFNMRQDGVTSTGYENTYAGRGPYYRYPRPAGWRTAYGASPWDVTYSNFFSNDGTKYFILYYNKIVEYTLEIPYVLYSGKRTGDTGLGYYFQKTRSNWHSYTRNPYPLYLRAGYIESYTRINPYTGRVWYYQYRECFYHTGFPQGFKFSNDGTKLWVIYGRFYNYGRIYQYDLASAYDISSLAGRDSYIDHEIGEMTNSSLNVTHSKRRSAWDIAVSNDGLKFYILDNLTLKVYQYASSQSNDISGLPTDAGRLKLWASLYDATLDFSGVANDIECKHLTFNASGSKLYISNKENIYEYSMATNFEISTATLTNTFSNITVSQNNIASGFSLSSDNTQLYYSENKIVKRKLLNVAGDSADINGAYEDSSLTIPFLAVGTYGSNSPSDIRIENKGKSFYISETAGTDTIQKFILSDSNEIESAVLNGTFNPSVSALTGFALNDSENKLYTIDNKGPGKATIASYDIDATFASSTATGEIYAAVGDWDYNAQSISWNNDGTEFYILGRSTNGASKYGFDVFKTKRKNNVSPI